MTYNEILRLDHLVITAATLEAGAEYVAQTLGVSLQNGGQHIRMGTHNKLLKLGDDLYLEVIAVDPQMSAPGRPRWFDLDRLTADSQPQLATWVAQTQNIELAVAKSPVEHGVIESMRRGDLQWQITIPPDGKHVLNGAVPGLIQWPDVHPASAMEESGCRLQSLEIFSAFGDELDNFLKKLNFEGRLLVHRLPAEEGGFMRAHIETPQGLRVLGGK